jgi:hypothetical protein
MAMTRMQQKSFEHVAPEEVKKPEDLGNTPKQSRGNPFLP